MRRLEGKVAVIAGSSRGIGAARFDQGVHDRSGAAPVPRTVCLDIDGGAAEAIAAELGDSGARAGAAYCDVRDSDSVRAGVEAAVTAFGRLDVAVANAATVTPRAAVDALSLDDWRDALDVNLTGAFLLCKHAIPHLRARGSGSIIRRKSPRRRWGVSPTTDRRRTARRRGRSSSSRR